MTRHTNQQNRNDHHCGTCGRQMAHGESYFRDDQAVIMCDECAIKQVEDALGSYLCTDAQPCAAFAYYDEGEGNPWRIADDHDSERFATFEEAIAGAEAWAEAMA